MSNGMVSITAVIECKMYLTIYSKTTDIVCLILESKCHNSKTKHDLSYMIYKIVRKCSVSL